MSSAVRFIAKENSSTSVSGKVNPSGGIDFSSVKKRSKALSDVKNTILQRDPSKLDPKKQLKFDNNCQFNLEKNLTEKPQQNTSSSIIIKEIETSVTSVPESNTEIEEEIVSLPLCAVSDVDDDFDIDECPSCIKSDIFDDWLYGIGMKEWTDEDIMKICCGTIPRPPASPVKHIDDWFKEEYKPISSCTAIGKFDEEISSFSTVFEFPVEFYLQNPEIVPVYLDD